MKDVLRNEDFNVTLRLLILFFAFIFIVHNITSCEKKEIPLDPEESILDYYEVSENWQIETDEQPEHVIGVTKWKKIKKE